MRFHALGVQHTVTSKEYVACAFTQKVLKFCSMMTLRGHTVIHYGHEDSDVECTEHVNVLSREDYNRTYGDHDFRSKLFKFDQNDDAYKTFNSNAIREINKRKQSGDILLAFWGAGHQAICDGAGSDMKVVEPGIGYPWGHFAEYKIFESYAMYHAFLQRERVAQCSDMNLWSKEAVIPNYFSISDFVDEVVPAKDRGDYFLFVGRIGTAKGVQYAIQMTERLGIRLIIAGQNAEEGLREVGMFPPPAHVEVTGHIDAEKRKTLMANAKAVVCMSTFAEPFCGVHVEALMSGTPVITADWGAFTEINMHGVTGFRCRTLDQMVEAGRRIHEIDPMVCRKWAMDNFSNDRVAEMYEAFFEGKMKPIDRTTRKVAVWCETKWALGRIGRAIKKYVPNVDLYNWSTNEDNDPLWKQGGWKKYDFIISNTSLHSLNKLYGIDVTDEMRRRFVVIAHCPRFEGMKNFQETLDGHNTLSRYCGVSRETCDEMKKYDVEATYVPFGADTDVFPWEHKVTGPIRRIGIIGGTKAVTQSQEEYNEYVKIKGLDMFADICERGGFEPVYIFGKGGGKELYDGFDVLICCSQLEGGPLGIFEAASCGIPVLTRRVGNAQYVKGIATFDTADEALRQLDIWNGDVDGLREYATAVTKEVRINWSMRTLITRHLVPVLENSVNLTSIPVVYMHSGKSERKKNMNKTLDGFTDVTCYNCQHKITSFPYCAAYNKDLIDILETRKLPFIFMEDDCSKTPWFTTNVSYPDDADAVYLGNSEWGMIPGEISGTFRGVAWDKVGQCARVYNMLGMHGILIISERWRDALKACCRMGIHQDVALTRIMKEFNAYALYKPIVYQDPMVGGTQTHPVTFDSIPQYKGDINFRTVDFIEIGTSDFNTEIQKATGKMGLSVEPIKHYLDSLPDVEGVTKVNAAVSNYDGYINVYSITPEIIKKYDLPEWLRGCNSVNSYHPTTLRYVLEKKLDEREVFTVDRVPVMSFFTLVQKYNIHGCRYLKIDTEGHDIVIVNSYLDCVARGCVWFPLIPKIQFEANCLVSNDDVESVLQRLYLLGYEVTHRDCDDIIVELNL